MQRVVEQNVIAAAQQMEDHIDGELHRLENLDEDDLDRLRERRIRQLKQQAVQRQQWLARGHGEYQDVPSEKEFFAAMKGEPRMVCHFYRENWPCKVKYPPPPNPTPSFGKPFLAYYGRMSRVGFADIPTTASKENTSAYAWCTQVMDKHLQTLSQKHIETRFVRVSNWQLPGQLCISRYQHVPAGLSTDVPVRC